VKISLAWLGRHVDLADLSAEEVARDLTIHTAEVEGVERFAPWLDDVVVGHVVERGPHPDADKLSLCRVDVGEAGEPLQIVCGAPNVAAGQRVAVARVGTVLPGDFKLKKSKIRGVESCGMICSLRELELGDDHSGIWVLPAEARVGAPVAGEVGLDDWVIEIDNKSLTHRPDLWGHRGLAGEVAAIRGRELVPLDLTLPRTAAGEPYPVRVESKGCFRYLGLAIDGVTNGPSPAWLANLLLAVGQRPLDLLVDLSNFVMLDLGQPNHLFDRRLLSPEGIVVRDARPGETMRTLDEVERRFVPDDMLICSGDEPVAIAGVMGGERSKVTADTSELLLEVASFHPTVVRRTSARLGLRTDASARFEKSLDPTLPAKAAARLARLLLELQPGVRFPRPVGDAGEWTDPARTLAFRPERARAVLGADVPDAEMQRTLSALGFGVRTIQKDATWEVAVPSARATKDVGIEEDLIEEIGRMHGYGRIAERRLVAEIVPPPRDERRLLVRALQDRLSGAARFHEAMTYTVQGDELLERLGLLDEGYVEIVNPVAEGFVRVRRSLAPSLVGLLAANRRNRSDVRLYEIGKGYRPATPSERGEPAEHHLLALLWARPKPAGGRYPGGVLHRLQAVVQDLVGAVGRELPAWGRAEGLPGYLLGARALGAGGVAWVAELDPAMPERLGLEREHEGEVAVAEVSLDALLAAPERRTAYRPPPRFPSVKVDVALSVPEERTAGELEAAIRAAGKGLVGEVELFDLFRGERLGAGRKSLAYHVVLQAAERTLSDADVAKFLARLERQAGELGGELRRE